MWILSSRLTAFKLSFLKWWWMISLSHWWRGRSKAVSLSEQTWSSSSSSTTPRCSIAKKHSSTGLEEQKSLTDFCVCVSILFLYFYISIFLCEIRFRFVYRFFLYLFCIFRIILLPNIMFWTGEGGRAGISKNVTNFVTDARSQLTWEGGRAGISKNVTSAGSQLTF